MKLILGIVCADIPQRLKISSRYVDHNLYSQEKALERRATKISTSALAMRSLFHFPSELPRKSEIPTQHDRLIALPIFLSQCRPQILEKKKMAQ
jgi:hypothetical protein